MLKERVRVGMIAGGLVASAMAGVFVGFGASRGQPELVFSAMGRALVPNGAHPVTIVAGVFAHFAWILAWCAAHAIIAGSARGVRLVTSALMSGALLLLLATAGSPLLSRAGLSGWTDAHLVASVVVFTITLAVGSRLAHAR